LKSLLKELDDILLQAETSLSKLKEILPKHDVTEQLVKCQETEQETVFAAALSTYDTIVATIRKATNTNDLLTKIQQETQIFNQKKNTNAQLLQRQNVLQNFDIAYQNYLQLKAYLGEGTQFYITLQESLQKFKSKCYDFTFARKTEKQDLVAAIQTKQVPLSQQSSVIGNNMAPPTITPQGTFQLFQAGRGGGGQPQPVVYTTQGVPIIGGGRGTPVIVQQPQVLQPQQFRVTPSPGVQGFQPVMLVQQPQVQLQHHQAGGVGGGVFNPQQAPPPSYTQSQAQRSVFPENPYGNLGPSAGF